MHMIYTYMYICIDIMLRRPPFTSYRLLREQPVPHLVGPAGRGQPGLLPRRGLRGEPAACGAHGGAAGPLGPAQLLE